MANLPAVALAQISPLELKVKNSLFLKIYLILSIYERRKMRAFLSINFENFRIFYLLISTATLIEANN